MRSITLRETIRPLLLAPAGALSVIALLLLFFDEEADFGFQLTTLLVLAYALGVCYLAELLFVVPGLALRPGFRQPHLIAAGTYGIAVALVVPTARLFIEGHGLESFGIASAAGAASGLLYSVLAQRQRG